MAKRLPVSDAQIRWLRNAQGNLSYQEQAAYIGVCVDTLKRILMRHNIASFDGAKYLPSTLHQTASNTWRRPCMCCGSTKPRPKNQYICSPCKTAHAEDEADYYTVAYA